MTRWRFSLRWMLIAVTVTAIGVALLTDPQSPTEIPDGFFVQPGRGGKPLVPFKRKKKYGYLDEKGRVAIPPRYGWADEFLAGFALCQLNGKDLVIDERGAIVGRVPAPNETFFRASDERIWFRRDNKWGLSDLQGNVLLEPTYDDVDRFSEGLSRVNAGAKLEFPGFMEGGRHGYVDKHGRVAIALEFEEFAWDFHDGVAVIGDQLIDRSGKLLFEARGMGIEMSDGLIPVEWKTDSTRYFGKDGKVRFEVGGSGDEFSEGLAAVRDGKRCYYVGADGRRVFSCPPGATRPLEFKNGLARLEMGDECWGYINREGELVTPTHFNELEPAEKSYMIVHYGGQQADVMDAPPFWIGGRWIMIDRRGRPLAVLREDSEGP